jgi:hypothetical protein
VSFLAPLAGILAALTLPVVVLLYFLRLKRRQLTIPSTILWQRSFLDLRANTPFQKLRRNLLMFLQLLIFAFLALALAQPLVKAAASTGRSIVLVVDVSASMSVRELEGTRLDAAKKRCDEIINGMGTGDEAMVVAFHRRAETVEPFNAAKGLISEAVGKLRARDTGTEIREALIVASGAVKAAVNPEVYIITDGGFGKLPELPQIEELPIRVVLVGAERANLGITACDVRSPPQPGSGPQVFVAVENVGEQPAETKVEFRLDGKLLHTEALTLAAGEVASALTDLEPSASGLCEVRLTSKDAFTVDDVVRTWIVPERKFRVTLVAEGNWALERLLPVMPQIEASKVRPEDFQREGAMAGVSIAPDVIILDTPAAEAAETLPPGNYLLLGGTKLPNIIADAEDLKWPAVLDWDRTHPLTRFLTFSHLNVVTARNWELPEEAKIVVEAEQGPLIATLSGGGVRMVLMAFDPFTESDWMLRRSYPLFMANCIEWLAGGATPQRGHHQRCGSTLLLDPAPDAKELTVVDPAGKPHTVKVDETGTTTFGDTWRMGLYEVSKGERLPRTVAFNLVDPDESRIAVNDDVQPEPAEGEEGEAAGAVQVGREVAEGQREAWRWVVLAAFLFLLFEWYVYHRRAI